MSKKIGWKDELRAYGRNGSVQSRGIAVWNYVGSTHVEFNPITTKGDWSNSAQVPIPLSKIPELIDALLHCLKEAELPASHVKLEPTSLVDLELDSGLNKDEGVAIGIFQTIDDACEAGRLLEEYHGGREWKAVLAAERGYVAEEQEVANVN